MHSSVLLASLCMPGAIAAKESHAMLQIGDVAWHEFGMEDQFNTTNIEMDVVSHGFNASDDGMAAKYSCFKPGRLNRGDYSLTKCLWDLGQGKMSTFAASHFILALGCGNAPYTTSEKCKDLMKDQTPVLQLMTKNRISYIKDSFAEMFEPVRRLVDLIGVDALKKKIDDLKKSKDASADLKNTGFGDIASECGNSCNDLPGGLNGIGNADLCIPDAKVELKLNNDRCTDEFFDLLDTLSDIDVTRVNWLYRDHQVAAARTKLDSCAKKSWQMFPFTKVQKSQFCFPKPLANGFAMLAGSAKKNAGIGAKILKISDKYQNIFNPGKLWQGWCKLGFDWAIEVGNTAKLSVRVGSVKTSPSWGIAFVFGCKDRKPKTATVVKVGLSFGVSADIVAGANIAPVNPFWKKHESFPDYGMLLPDKTRLEDVRAVGSVQLEGGFDWKAIGLPVQTTSNLKIDIDSTKKFWIAAVDLSISPNFGTLLETGRAMADDMMSVTSDLNETLGDMALSSVEASFNANFELESCVRGC